MHGCCGRFVGFDAKASFEEVVGGLSVNVSEMPKLDGVNPPFPSFKLRDKGLRPPLVRAPGGHMKIS